MTNLINKIPNQNSLKVLLGVLVLLLAFLVGRWGIWNYFPFAVIYSDSFEYYELAYNIFNGEMPSFHFIGGGYPLILSIIKGLYDSPFAIVLFQQLLSLFTVLFLIFTFRKEKKIFWAALFFSCIYITSDSLIKWELAIFTDSIFSNLYLISGILLYLILSKNKWYFAFLFGFVLFYCIFIRSSAVFLIPLSGGVILYLVRFKKRKAALILGSTFFGLLIALSAYNYFYSVGNEFDILTYGRFSYIEGPFNNSTVLKKNHKKYRSKIKLKDNEHVFVREKLKRELPENSYIWIRNFSWDISKYTLAAINTRDEIFTQIKNDSLFYCVRGNRYDVKCYPIKREANLSIDSLNTLVSNFEVKRTTLQLKGFLAFYSNLMLNYNQAYYSMVPASYHCTIEKSNRFIIQLGQTEKGRMLLEYVLGYGTDVKDEPGFRERYKRLKEDAIFKVYDLFNEQISKRFFRTVFFFQKPFYF